MFNVVGEIQLKQVQWLAVFHEFLLDEGSYRVDWLYYPSMFATIINEETTIFGLRVISLWIHPEGNFVRARDMNGNDYMIFLGRSL